MSTLDCGKSVTMIRAVLQEEGDFVGHLQEMENRGDWRPLLTALLKLGSVAFALLLAQHPSDYTVRCYDPGRTPPLLGPRERMARLLSQCAELDSEPNKLQRKLLDLLIWIDEIFQHPAYYPPLSIETDLSEFPGLTTPIQHWVQKPRSLAIFRRDQRLESSVGPNRYSATINDRLSCITFVPPREGLAIKAITHDVPLDSNKLSKPLRLGLSPLSARSHPLFQEVENDGVFGFNALPTDALKRPNELREILRVLIDEAALQEIDLLILPELMIDTPARDWFADLLVNRVGNHPHLTVVGSFHVSQGGSGKPYNEAQIWDREGNVLWSHCKQGTYSIPSLKGLEDYFPRGLPKHVPVPEAIAYGSEVLFYDLPTARITVLICSDVLDPGSGLEDALNLVRPDLALIIGMSEKTLQFEHFAERMARLDIGTLYLNSACTCPPARDFGLIDLAVVESALPYRWRFRRRGIYRTIPQCYDHKKNIWRSASSTGPESRFVAVKHLSAGPARFSLYTLDLAML